MSRSDKKKQIVGKIVVIKNPLIRRKCSDHEIIIIYIYIQPAIRVIITIMMNRINCTLLQ